MHALVTGATGFLGLYVVEQLRARGERVRALCRRPSAELQALGVEVVKGDVRDAACVERVCADVDTVFHCAAVAGIWGPWRHYFETNVLGARHVLAGCRRHGVQRLVYTSSPSVTFDGSDQCGVDESAPYPRKWLCHYSHTKALAEQEVLAGHQPGGLRTCALRPHLIWGPRDRHLIPRLIERARQGRLRRVGDGTNLIDTIYVENAARAHLQAADALSGSGAPGGRAYFISQGEPVRCWQWINELLGLAGLPPVRRGISERAAWVLGAACEAAYAALRLRGEPPMTRFLAAQLARSHYFSIARAERDLGYRPEVNTAEGLRRLAAELRHGTAGGLSG